MLAGCSLYEKHLYPYFPSVWGFMVTYYCLCRWCESAIVGKLDWLTAYDSYHVPTDLFIIGDSSECCTNLQWPENLHTEIQTHWNNLHDYVVDFDQAFSVLFLTIININLSGLFLNSCAC